ncbi:hypothetical protein UlMin_037964 [Ulmus minor]
MGPQSSWSSTLLNHLLQTSFADMDAYKGRSQTTKGIWIAKYVGIETCTISMDMEAIDGRKSGKIIFFIFDFNNIASQLPSSLFNTNSLTYL